jgi:hypothetical protein
VINHRCISLDSPSEWREALEGIEHTFAHTWENCYAMQLTSNLETYLYCFEADDVRIVCPISERLFQNNIDIVTPNGLPGFVGNSDYPDFPYHWNSFVKRKGYVCGYIGLNPVFDNPTYYEPSAIEHYNSVYVLDLTLSTDDLFANLDRNRRRQLRDWDNVRRSFVLDRQVLIDFFLGHYSNFVRRIGASRAYDFSEETLAFFGNADNVLIVGAGTPERVEAIYIFTYTPYSGDCLFNVSLPEGRHHATPLLWYGVNRLKSLEVPLLNLGGGVHENDSIALSKQRFGGRKLPLKRLKQIYEPDIYRELCHRVNVDPTDMTSYFPAYRSA